MEQENQNAAASLVQTLGTTLQSQSDRAEIRSFDDYIPANVKDSDVCVCGAPLLFHEKQCKECNAKHHITNNPAGYLRACNVPEIFISATFRNFDNADKISGLRKAVASNTLPHIVIQGVTGSGKSRISCQILRELCETGRAYKKSFYFLSAYWLVFEMQDTMGKDGGRKLDIVKRYGGYDVLVIDDLGFDDESRWAIGLFYALVDLRVNMGKSTIITTNLKLEEWKTSLGDRLASRMAGMEIFCLPFGDYRKKRG